MIEHKLTVFLGDVQDYLSALAKDYNASAWLLDQSNYKTLSTRRQYQDVVVYTSLGDLPKNLSLTYNILSQADRIYYYPPVSWSDGNSIDITDPDSSMQGMTEILLMLMPESVEVLGSATFSLKNFDPKPLVDQRKTDKAQLWIAGCSMSHGVGVTTEERYGELLAKDLDLPCSFLTRPGSAIDWAADQILRSDIRPGDLVVWGLTYWGRMTYVHNHGLLEGITASTYKAHPEYNKIIDIDNLVSEQTLYNHFYSIQQVINYCNKIGAKLVLVGLLHSYSLLGFLRSQKNYIHIPYQIKFENSILLHKFLDLGDDSYHPGPRQHQSYKHTILNFIKNQLH